MADDRSVLKPVAPAKPAPHPPMAQLYTPVDAPVLYLEQPSIAPGGSVTGSVIDDADASGYRRSVMMVEIETEADADRMVFLNVLPSLDGVLFSDPNGNTAEGDLYLEAGAFRLVLWNVPVPPSPFKMGLEYPAQDGATDLRNVRIRYAFYGTVDVPQ